MARSGLLCRFGRMCLRDLQQVRVRVVPWEEKDKPREILLRPPLWPASSTVWRPGEVTSR